MSRLVLVLAGWGIVGVGAATFVAADAQIPPPGMLTVIPVMLTAWVYGLRGAAVSFVVALPFTCLFSAVGGLDVGVLLSDATVWIGHLLTGGLGMLLGYSSTLRRRLVDEMARSAQTERARAKAEMEAAMLRANRLATMGTLTAKVAHELSSPLTYVIGNLEILGAELSELETAEPAEELTSRTADALEGATRMQALVDELRRFARDQPRRVEPVDLGDVIRDAVRFTRDALPPQAQLESKLEDVETIAGDASHLEQVFVNLITNAGHAVEQRSGARRIEVGCRMEGDEVIGWVEDDGVGIEPHIRDRLFDPFFTTKPVGRGTGLGLAVCSDIVTRHRGRLDLETAVGQGSKFIVRLPKRAPAA